MTLQQILVTGGSGFIGSNFIRHALQTNKSWHIVNLDALTYAGNPNNLSDLEKNKRYEFIHGDITDYKLLSNLFSRYKFDAVFHFAAESHVDRSIHSPRAFIDTNITGTFNLLEASLKHWEKQNKQPNFRFLHVSTDEVYRILVAKKDVLTTIDLLLDAGFVPEKGSVMDRKTGENYVDKEFNYTLVRYESRLNIDIQWDLSARFTPVPITFEMMKDRLETGTLNGVSISNFPAEELLCYLCLHGARHRWVFLDLVCCVNELICSRSDMDWEFVFGYAKKMQCNKVLLLGLALGRDLLGSPLPEWANNKIDGKKEIQKIEQEVYSGLFSDYIEKMIVDTKFDLFLITVMDSWLGRIRYCGRLVLLPTKEDLRCFPLPGWLSFLLYGYGLCA